MLTLKVNEQVSLEARTNTTHDLTAEKGLEKETCFIVWRVTNSSEIEIGRFFLSPLPGCCGVVVSHATYLTEQTRHSGLSDPFRKLKEQVARGLGYSVVIATTDMSNVPAVGNMIKSKYRIVDTFTNSRTGNLIGLGVKKLK